MADPEIFGREYFSKIYRDYHRQNPPYKLDWYCRLITEMSPACGRPRILDMGCAFGSFLGRLDPCWSKFGVDISEYAIERARRFVPEATLSVTSCTEIPFEGPFQAIVAFDVLEHVQNLEKVGSYVDRALAPDGVFFFVVPVYDGPLGWLVNALDRDFTHVHKKTRQFWLSWTEDRFHLAGWCGIFRYLLPWGPYLNWPTRHLRNEAPAVAIGARKRGAERAPVPLVMRS